MEWLALTNIEIQKTNMGTKICYEYDAPAALHKYIKGSALFVEFPCDVSAVPQAVLAVPFVGIMMTVTMLLGVKVKVPVLDSTFAGSVGKIESVFRKMYPRADFQVAVEAERTEDCAFAPGEKVSVFFTGGVDATSALAELHEKKPVLVNIWGGDLRLTDDASHVELEQYLENLTAYAGLEYCFIKTNAREMFRENELGELCEKLLGHRFNHGWWASIAHILSMTAAIAPWLWLNRIGTHYIGSSYDGKTDTFDSNNELFIGAIRYCACLFEMVDPGVGRIEKAGKIIRYRSRTGVPLQLKVCWQRTAGINCSACEKCYRTILNIIANHGDPNAYGFAVDKETMKRIEMFLKTSTVSKAFWKPIQESFRAEQEFWTKIPEISWILKIRVNSPIVYLRKLQHRLFR